jgi:hypothetical protein
MYRRIGENIFFRITLFRVLLLLNLYYNTLLMPIDDEKILKFKQLNHNLREALIPRHNFLSLCLWSVDI